MRLVETTYWSIYIIFILALAYIILPSTTTVATSQISNQTIKIAIIDTGYTILEGRNLKLCSTGHYDFSTKTPYVGLSIGNHGTKVGSIIADELKAYDYCAIIYKVQTAEGIPPGNITKALRLALKQHVAAVNISLTGPEQDVDELAALSALTASGTRVFIAAGNEGTNLDNNCNTYPACYTIKNIEVIGAIDPTRHIRASYSNYGKRRITQWYSGDTYLDGEEDHGTSFASPRALSRYIRDLR